MLRWAIVLACAVSIAALGAPSNAAEPLKVGYSIAKTGLLAAGAVQQERPYLLWRDQVNERGGLSVAGSEKRKVELVVYDDQSDAARTPGIYEKLIRDDKVDLLLAPYATPLHLAITPIIEKNRFPVVGHTAVSTQLRDLGGKYMFFAAPAPDDYAKQIVSFLRANGLRRVSMMTLELPMSLEMRKHTVALLKDANIEVVIDQRYPPDLKDMTAMLSSVKASKPDAILAYTYPVDGDMYLRQARELSIDTPVQFMMLGPAYPFLHEKHGANLDGIIGIGQWSPYGKWSGSKEFYDSYLRKFNTIPDYVTSAIVWVSLEILEQAVASAGLDREKLRNAIATGTFRTIMGPVKFEKQMGSVSAGLIQSQKGEAHLIWPAEIRTRQFQPKRGWQ